MQECFRQSVCWILRLFGLHVERFKALRFPWIRLFCRRAVNRGGSVQFAALVSGDQSHEWAAHQSKTHRSKLVGFRTHSVAHAKWPKRFRLSINRNKCVQIYFEPWNIPDIWLFCRSTTLCCSPLHTLLFLTRTSLQTTVRERCGRSYWLRCARARRWLVQARARLQFESRFCYYWCWDVIYKAWIWFHMVTKSCRKTLQNKEKGKGLWNKR